MINIKNFKLGEPTTPEQLSLREQHNAMFLYAEDGTEWYSCQKNFAKDSIKLAYDKRGVIRSIAVNKDVSTLWPADLSVVEVMDTEYNRQADISGEWIFDGEKISKRIYLPQEYQEKAMVEQAARLATATKAIAPLQDAVELNIANETEIALLTDWKTYRVMLNRLDLTAAPNIDWPPEPHL
ncbi:tail fiber assembly protein [Serratia rhizosphaerae]